MTTSEEIDAILDELGIPRELPHLRAVVRKVREESYTEGWVAAKKHERERAATQERGKE